MNTPKEFAPLPWIKGRSPYVPENELHFHADIIARNGLCVAIAVSWESSRCEILRDRIIAAMNATDTHEG